MKNLIKIFILLVFLTVLIIPQEQPNNDKRLIVLPDGKVMSGIDGTIISDKPETNFIKQNRQLDSPPIGTPYSWDNNLGFYAGSSDWTVNAIAVSGSDVYVGGDFLDANGNSNADHIVKYNQKTNTYEALGLGLNGSVYAIAVSGNDVYVGGNFTDAGGNSSADYIARWDGNNWNALGVGLNDNVYAIAIQGNNVYVGGGFTSAGGIFESDYIAKWDGSSWSSMGQLDGFVRAITVSGSEVFVGGEFSSASAVGFNYFAIYDGSSNVWGGDLGANLNGEVLAIAISGSDLYLGGVFKDVGGDTLADAIVYFNLDTFSGWQSLGNGIITNDAYYSYVASIAAIGKDLYVGGLFLKPYSSDFDFIAYWNGTTWDSLDTGYGLAWTCRALALSGTDLFVGHEYGFSRWFGSYASGLYGGVQKPLTDGTGFLEFNTANDSTVISLELNYYNGNTGTFNVFCYEDKILDGTILPIANHRWIIQQTGLPGSEISGTIRIKVVDLPDSSGIIYPGSSGIGIFQRSTPGREQFNDLTPFTWYDSYTGEYVTPFFGTGEFVIGLPNTVDGVISVGEYGTHEEGENMLTSDGKTWYMKSDEYYFYFGISNYTNENDAINIYLDNSGISPVNYPWDYYGTLTGTGKDGVTPNLPFGAEFFAYVKPAYDEYRYTDQFGGWMDSVAISFIRSYNDAGNVFEFAIPISSLPVSTNIYNYPLDWFNWLGFLSNSGNISSRVPSNPNPSGILNDLVWYFATNIYSPAFKNNCYTHIGPSIPNFGAFDCYEFTFYPQSPTTFINRTSGVWNIEGDLWVYNGTLTFQNSDSVNVGGFLTAGGTTNFSYNTSDAPLNLKYFLWQWPLGGTLFMDSGHYLNFVPTLYNSNATFQSNALYQNIVVNNPSKVYLRSDMKINQSLTLLNGNIQTITNYTPPDTFRVILNSGAIIGGSGYIEGSLVQYVDLAPGPNGGDSPDNLVVNFPVGTANGPSPVSFDFSSVTSPGKLTVEAFQSIHPNTIDSSETLGRYWRITKDENLAFTSADITFNYRPEDFNGTTFSEETDEASMIVGKYDASWSYPSIFTRTPGGINDGGSITISGVTSFSDFTMFKSQLSANVRVFLEGPYLSGSMSTALNTGGSIPLSQPYYIDPWGYNGTETVASIPSGVVDWVLLELRSNPTTQVARRAAFVRSNGSLVDLDGTSNVSFTGVPAGNYYLVIYHRNHLPIMTASTVSVSETPTLYDLSTGQGQAYGTNAMKDLGGGVFGLFTADTDGNGTVNATDRSNAWNQRNLSGYYGTDVDLSGTVNASDRSSVWNNRNITTQVPALVDVPILEIAKENNQ
ncbi:MAG: hypothetical protein HXY48_14005 [Ignavibacteriaceae bacterium]|nr:hypothetical protein [Ignavibacteriaceae bacterium]